MGVIILDFYSDGQIYLSIAAAIHMVLFSAEKYMVC